MRTKAESFTRSGPFRRADSSYLKAALTGTPVLHRMTRTGDADAESFTRSGIGPRIFERVSHEGNISEGLENERRNVRSYKARALRLFPI